VLESGQNILQPIAIAMHEDIRVQIPEMESNGLPTDPILSISYNPAHSHFAVHHYYTEVIRFSHQPSVV
jgi:hypothetical protein